MQRRGLSILERQSTTHARRHKVNRFGVGNSAVALPLRAARYVFAGKLAISVGCTFGTVQLRYGVSTLQGFCAYTVPAQRPVGILCINFATCSC
eukprot:6230847-Amphidinium_carterae.1